MGAFDNGFNFGMRAYQDALVNKRQAVRDERDAEEFTRKKAGWDRADKLQRMEDVAFSEVDDLQRTGQVVGKNTSGFSNPSAQMLHGQGGQAAVDEAASYANVENRRFGLPAVNTTSVPADAAAAPVPTVTMRQATELDRVGAMERLATARRDVGAMERLAGQRKTAQLDLDRKGEVARLEKLSDDEFLGELKRYINPNADVPAMLGYDPKSKQFTLVSDVPGVPTQTLSRAELLQGALGAWEMGKGDYAAGLQMLVNNGKTQRELSTGNFDRSVKVAGMNQKADNDAGTLAVAQQNADTKSELSSIRASIAAARGGGRGGEADSPSFNPLGSFDTKKAQAVAFEQAAAAVDATGKPLSPQEQGKRAQEIYRSMEDAFATENTRRQRATVFRAEARNATTPEQIDAVRQRAAASGYTAEEMAALDKRFAPAAPAASTSSGQTSNGSPLTSMRDALSPAYMPPPDSPAGKAKASREAVAAMSVAKVQAASDAAQAAIASKDPAAAQAVQDMPGFVSLPAKQKAEIRSIVFGR